MRMMGRGGVGESGETVQRFGKSVTPSFWSAAVMLLRGTLSICESLRNSRESGSWAARSPREVAWPLAGWTTMRGGRAHLWSSVEWV